MSKLPDQFVVPWFLTGTETAVNYATGAMRCLVCESEWVPPSMARTTSFWICPELCNEGSRLQERPKGRGISREKKPYGGRY